MNALTVYKKISRDERFKNLISNFNVELELFLLIAERTFCRE
jgi:hypothetical protein